MEIVRKGLLNNLKNANPTDCTEGIMKDVYDGLLYKRIVAQMKDDCVLLTFSFATDGAPLNESTKTSFWSTLLGINELPPQLQFKYPLLAGLWMGVKEPKPEIMNLYMESFGCSWCYSEGQHLHGSMRYLMEEHEPAKRSHYKYLLDMDAAQKIRQSSLKREKVLSVNKDKEKEDDEEKDDCEEAEALTTSDSNQNPKKKLRKNAKTIRGVKGFSVLTDLQGFDMQSNSK
ncbi:uncharacterized protein LOC117171711 [Belonocnema kinseyi]|uniref:uncharacterized protein LOC117171711 n=1 Tax=Belonocnema kinseyi TaxID=2817044 RepID=UPI00143D8A03|nr:uncharacterized protein LOC117171711 [Belonocnema kinseyi]